MRVQLGTLARSPSYTIGAKFVQVDEMVVNLFLSERRCYGYWCCYRPRSKSGRDNRDRRKQNRSCRNTHGAADLETALPSAAQRDFRRTTRASRLASVSQSCVRSQCRVSDHGLSSFADF